MSSPGLSIGGVFELASHANPVRVVGLDDHVVMYDTWWPHLGAWAMAKLVGRFTYYRMSRAHFESQARLLRVDPFSELELSVHRPDLPFSFAQRADLSWYEQWSEAGAISKSTSTGTAPALDAPAVFLEPFGPRGSPKPLVLFHASNGRFFTEEELLHVARAAQARFIGDVRLTNGVGLYRSGIKKRIPSFYLWGAISKHEAAD